MRLHHLLGLVGLAALSALPVAPATAATKAALVESVLPSRPFNNSVNGSANYVTLGPGTSGVLGITSITFTNLGSVNRSIFVFAPILAGGQDCGSTNVIGGSFPRFYVQVPAGQTVHLTYPSPLVYTPISGVSCVAFGNAASVDITVNGLLN